MACREKAAACMRWQWPRIPPATRSLCQTCGVTVMTEAATSIISASSMTTSPIWWALSSFAPSEWQSYSGWPLVRAGGGFVFCIAEGLYAPCLTALSSSSPTMPYGAVTYRPHVGGGRRSIRGPHRRAEMAPNRLAYALVLMALRPSPSPLICMPGAAGCSLILIGWWRTSARHPMRWPARRGASTARYSHWCRRRTFLC